MRLDTLFADVPENIGELEITRLAYDWRGLPGALFFCLRDATRDGHDFAAQVVEAGAVALVVNRPLPVDAPQIQVADVRAAAGRAAAVFYGDPSRELDVVGVTGTNGKTTTTYLMQAILEADGRHTGRLGTISSVIGGVERPVQGTALPPAIDLQRMLREMLDHGDRACVIEVFSHALALPRVDCIEFAVAIFTNLTRDHLDFHQTMENYYAAKRRLFTEGQTAQSVINLDDVYGARLAREPALDGRVATFALTDPAATFRATDVSTGLKGSSFTVLAPDGAHRITSPLRGRFNVYNVLGAFAAARTLGVSASTAAAAIEDLVQVPGRFESVDEGQPFEVLVDYAHTPDSLENVLSTARGLTDCQVHVVFGCGGDRDPGKRPQMGEIAARLADRVTVTSTNPRSEDPEAIIAEILRGIGRDVIQSPDRRDAITGAIERAEPGDVVVITGKGHEHNQELEGGRRVPFNDVEVARRALRARTLVPSDRTAATES